MTTAIVVLFLLMVEALEYCHDASDNNNSSTGSIRNNNNTKVVGVCPTGNTCCRKGNGSFGCIPSDMGKLHATCCSHDRIGDDTGCPVDYDCIPGNRCRARPSTAAANDPLVRVLPRYRLCSTPRDQLETVHTFPLGKHTNGDPHASTLAYYSSHGDLNAMNDNNPSRQDLSTVDHVLVVIHGSGRNADDYFCAATSAVDTQTIFCNVLVIVPWFLCVTDDHTGVRDDALRWAVGDGDGPWRYGADAVSPPHSNTSSFEALDQLIRFIQRQIPTSTSIVVAGHSSGGQFVQRYALLSPVLDNGGTNTDTDIDTHTNRERSVRAVVANPSSYAYLTPLRFFNGRWKLPAKGSCPTYDQWEHGLELGGTEQAPYVMRVLQNTTLDTLIHRFAMREVTYLAGGLDRCNVAEPGWCNSHGLETTCSDELQGTNRWERGLRYIRSLEQVVFSGTSRHTRIVVDQVGHDHSLMFTQPAGIRALFGYTRQTVGYGADGTWTSQK